MAEAGGYGVHRMGWARSAAATETRVPCILSPNQGAALHQCGAPVPQFLVTRSIRRRVLGRTRVAQEIQEALRLELTSLPAIALAVVLVLLGHDALMVANPHAGPNPHSAPATGEPLPAPCVLLDVAPAASPGLSTAQASHAACMMLSLVLQPEMRVERARELAPDHPPDVRRAFLQVFLN